MFPNACNRMFVIKCVLWNTKFFLDKLHRQNLHKDKLTHTKKFSRQKLSLLETQFRMRMLYTMFGLISTTS